VGSLAKMPKSKSGHLKKRKKSRKNNKCSRFRCAVKCETGDPQQDIFSHKMDHAEKGETPWGKKGQVVGAE